MVAHISLRLCLFFFIPFSLYFSSCVISVSPFPSLQFFPCQLKSTEALFFFFLIIYLWFFFFYSVIFISLLIISTWWDFAIISSLTPLNLVSYSTLKIFLMVSLKSLLNMISDCSHEQFLLFDFLLHVRIFCFFACLINICSRSQSASHPPPRAGYYCFLAHLLGGWLDYCSAVYFPSSMEPLMLFLRDAALDMLSHPGIAIVLSVFSLSLSLTPPRK